MLLTVEQKVEVEWISKFQEHLELMQLKDELLMTHLKVASFRAPPGLEDQRNMWPPQPMLKPSEDKFVCDKDDETTDPGSGSDRETESSEDEGQFKLCADAPEFLFTKLSADAAVFDPAPKLSADAPAFKPTPLRTELRSNAKLFMPANAKTNLNSDAQLFVPQSTCAAPKTVKVIAPKAKTKLALMSTKSDLFVPAWPELNASVEMKKKEGKC